MKQMDDSKTLSSICQFYAEFVDICRKTHYNKFEVLL